MTNTNDKQVIQDAGIDPNTLPTDAQGNVADITPHTANAPQRFTDAEIVKEAATDAHPDVLNGEGTKARVDEVLMGTAVKCAEGLFDAVTADMVLAVTKLKNTKDKEERIKLLDTIGDANHRLGLILENFL